MLILTIRTDKPEAELGIYEDLNQLAYSTWLAHRELAETIQYKLDELLKSQSKQLKDISGIVVFEGPGSFTGLRIGISIANALAYSLDIPIVAEGDEWIAKGIDRLMNNQNDSIALPEYGSLPNITQQRK